MLKRKSAPRYEAKKAKNFAEADRIRDELKAAGVELTDIPGGAKWNRRINRISKREMPSISRFCCTMRIESGALLC